MRDKIEEVCMLIIIGLCTIIITLFLQRFETSSKEEKEIHECTIFVKYNEHYKIVQCPIVWGYRESFKCTECGKDYKEK